MAVMGDLAEPGKLDSAICIPQTPLDLRLWPFRPAGLRPGKGFHSRVFTAAPRRVYGVCHGAGTLSEDFVGTYSIFTTAKYPRLGLGPKTTLVPALSKAQLPSKDCS